MTSGRMRERYIVDEDGNRVAAVLPIEEYQHLLDQLEDLEDIRLFDKAMASGEEAIPLEDFIREIENGLR